MNDSITPELIVGVLRRARSVAPDRSGESGLDRLIRKAKFDAHARVDIQHALRPVSGALQTALEWQAFQVLVGQLRLNDPKLGEMIDTRIGSGGLVDAVAQLWAARSLLSLGGTLSPQALDKLSFEGMTAEPVLWFGIIMDTQEKSTVEDAFVQLAASQSLSQRQMSDVVRGFKRWAVKNGWPWNGPVSRFFESLPAEHAVELGTGLFDVVGPSFVARAQARVAATAEPPLRGAESLVSELRRDFFVGGYTLVLEPCPAV